MLKYSVSLKKPIIGINFTFLDRIMLNEDYNNFTGFARRHTENMFRNEPPYYLFCNPNDTADLCAFQFIEDPTPMPIFFPKVSSRQF